jgi:tight adherence protein C
MLAVLFFILTFATVGALVWAGISLLTVEENPLADRLQELQSSAMVSSTSTRARRTGQGGFLNWLLYIISMIPGGEDWIEDSEKELNQAGIRTRSAVALYAIFNFVFMGLLMAGAIWLQKDKPVSQILTGLLAPLILGFLLPKQVLHRLVKRYRNKLQEALPDTVDLLGIVLGTGLALDQAMTRVSEEMQHIYPELANEFYTLVMQVRAGQERTIAFQQLVRRTGIEDLKSLAAMIVQSERFGTSLAQALKVYADALRTRRRLRADEAVGKAGIKMLFPIVLFILPVVFVITLVPAMITVMQNMDFLTGGRP